MKINVISLAAYVLLFLIVAKGAFSINGTSKLSLENTKLRGEISKLDRGIPRLEFERERHQRQLKHLGYAESLWLSDVQEHELTLFRLNAEKTANKRLKLEEDLKKAKEELAKSETKKKKAPQRPKMSSRRKYFLTHGMYPEQYAARQEQRAIIYEQRRSAQLAQRQKQARISDLEQYKANLRAAGGAAGYAGGSGYRPPTLYEENMKKLFGE